MDKFLFIGLALLAAGCFLWARGRAAEKRLGVPVRYIKSADVGVAVPLKESSIPKVLKSRKHLVAGKPDYVVADQDFPGGYIPVEDKSARARAPKDADIMQVLTCCFLLEEEGYPVKRGRLVYPTGVWDIPYGPDQRQMVLRVVEEMRIAELSGWKDMPRKQDHRCGRCAYRKVCA